MVKKYILSAVLASVAMLSAPAQENQVTRLPEVDNTHEYRDLNTYNTGFFIAGELSAGYSCRLSKPNFVYTELDVVAGYRFSEFLQVGAGIGGRYYINNDKVRYSSIAWAGPIFANIRGNIIPHLYRHVVPFYSVDLGGSIRDGFMFRPKIGLRIGEPRSAFLVSLGYMAQGMGTYSMVDGPAGPIKVEDNSVVSFVNLTIGYQF